MARYREKDETDLRWNHIRRVITREFDTRLMKLREAALNKFLSTAWAKYAAALESGQKLEVESAYEELVERVISGKVGIELSDL